jgi:hypothetical protein
MARRFELLRGGTVLGVVTLDPGESDFPWFVGWLKPSPEYATVRPLFDELDRVLEDEGFNERSGELHERVMRPGVRMRSLPNGEESEVLGITVSGTRVSWRQ